MKGTNESPHEWIKIISLGIVILLVTAAIIVFARLGAPPDGSQADLTLPSETPLSYPLPPEATDAIVSGYPPPPSTIEFVATETPEPTQVLVLIGTDEWGPPTTPVPTLGSPVAVTHAPGQFDSVIALVPPAADAHGTLVYFVKSEDGQNLTAQGIELNAQAQSLTSHSLISELTGVPYGWVYPSPNGSRVAIIDRGWGYTYVLDTYTGKFIYLANILPSDGFFGWHPDNTNVLFENGGSMLLGNLETGSYITLVSTYSSLGIVCNGVMSPSGQVYIYVSCDGFNPEEVWLVGIDGRGASKVYSGYVNLFSWSPDGQAVAFYGDDGIMVMEANGLNPRRASDLVSPPCPFWPPLWSPDGSTLAVATHNGAGKAYCNGWSDDAFVGTDIYLIDVASGTTRPLLSDGSLGNIDPAWSPDGRYLAFVSNRSGSSEIWVVSVDGSGLHQLTNAGQYVRFPFWRKP